MRCSRSALGANAVGFDFALGERQVDAATVHDIVRRLPAGVLSIGTFRNEMPQRVAEVANTIGLSGRADRRRDLERRTQLHHGAVNTVLRTVPRRGREAGAVAGRRLPRPPRTRRARPRSRRASSSWPSSSARLPLIAAGGLTPGNVIEVVQRLGVFGVEVRAGVESAPGKKDPVKLGEFIANARWAQENSLVERPYNEWSL